MLLTLKGILLPVKSVTRYLETFPIPVVVVGRIRLPPLIRQKSLILMTMLGKVRVVTRFRKYFISNNFLL